jgi:polyphosphate kinase
VSQRYLNRHLSLLEFNRRVLAEARRRRHALLERLKFLAIFSSNLDEFFMVKVADLRDEIDAGIGERSLDGLLPAEQLARIRPIVVELAAEQHRCWADEIRPELKAAGVHVLDYAELDEAQRAEAERIFYEQIFPVLTPIAVDPARPFPHISNLSLSLALTVLDPRHEPRFARIKVPGVLPRLLQLRSDREHTVLVWIEQVIAAHVGALFRGMEVTTAYPFKVTRHGDVDMREDEAVDLLETIELGLRRRQFGPVVRLTIDESMPKPMLDILLENLEIDPDDVYRVRGPLGLGGLMQLYGLDRPDLKDQPFVPAMPAAFTDGHFNAVARQDILLHHPFESFLPVVELIRSAADDPNVLAIKQTLYRVGRDSPIVAALMRARQKGKQVTVLVELKARFDEENNIEWARQLEEAGVHVVYGLIGLKTHCKVALIVRREQDGLRRYMHLSTGNYNATTARLYTDICMFTRDEEIGADASELFNALTGYAEQKEYRRLAVAPVGLRDHLMRLIRREIEVHQATGLGRLIFKTNALTDGPIIDALYEASAAGVQIDLIVRGMCSLRPGVPGLSETIQVRSIIGRFLEHSRIYYFENGGNPEVFLSSADLMRRNLNRRVETMFPVRQPDLLARLRDEVLDAYLRDTANAHLLGPDGQYQPPSDDPDAFDSQAWLITVATSQVPA